MALNEPAAPLLPHPHIDRYYGGATQKRAFLKNIFDETAADYDRVEGILAIGSGRWYRRQALLRAGLKAGDRVLDVAIGTGLVAREALRIVGEQGSVIGLDPSIGMLSQAVAALNLPAVLGTGEELPLADASVDFVSMGYALRHLADLSKAFSEFHRVLKPGGRICLLEITKPAGALGRKAMAIYFRGLLPVLSRVVRTKPQTKQLWVYYWETIDQCVPGETVLAALRAAGFSEPKRRVELGIFAEYTAVVPSPGNPGEG